jgi:hypothetical protein
MDTKSLISEARARFNHNQAKEYLRDKYESKLTAADQGGLWKITPELISFLSSRLPNSTHIILVDSYDNPCKVDTEKLLKKLQSVYDEVMESWYTEWKELEKNR